MRVLVAGASGVIGRRLVPLLTAVGHDVIALSRSTGGPDMLDRDAAVKAVRRIAPDVVVNMLTAIPAALNPRTLARDFELTNRLRTEGTRHLLEAAPDARHIAQGLAFAYRPAEGLAGEDAPLWSDAPAQFAPNVRAMVELERLTVGAGGLVLRYGHLTGPGSIYDKNGSTTAAVLAGRMPIVGDGGSVFSFTHAHDAATAVVAALDRDVSGALNVVDDTPMAVRDWLPAFARKLGAPAPRRVPAFVAKLVVGGFGVAFMTRLRGADNSRARLVLNWRPRHASFLDDQE